MHPDINELAISDYVAGTWQADPERSRIGFTLRQLVGKVRGTFPRHEVAIVTGEHVLDSTVVATIELASIDTGNEKRDRHLAGSTYLQVEAHPVMTYRSTRLTPTEHGLTIVGDLTMLGVTRSVLLDLTEARFASDGSAASFVASAAVRRSDFGLAIPMAAGGVVIADTIGISLQIQAIRQT